MVTKVRWTVRKGHEGRVVRRCDSLGGACWGTDRFYLAGRDRRGTYRSGWGPGADKRRPLAIESPPAARVTTTSSRRTTM